MTYYDILNVSENATGRDIKQSYHQLSKKYHPDKNKGDDTMFKKISEAYQVLSDTEERRKYDFKLKPMDTMMFRPRFNIHINSMFQNMDILFQTQKGNVSSESVSNFNFTFPLYCLWWFGIRDLFVDIPLVPKVYRQITK